MKPAEVISAAKKHPAIKGEFTESAIKAIVEKYFSRIDYTATKSAKAEVEHMIEQGYFDIA